MTNQAAKLINNKTAKLLVVDEKLAKDVERLSEKMNTTPADVIVAALELLKLSLGREVSLHKPKSDVEMRIPVFKSIAPDVKLDGE